MSDEQPQPVEIQETSGQVVEQPAEKPLPTIDTITEYDFGCGQWFGTPNYGCPSCLFRSLDKELVREHFFDIHLVSRRA